MKMFAKIRLYSQSLGLYFSEYKHKHETNMHAPIKQVIVGRDYADVQKAGEAQAMRNTTSWKRLVQGPEPNDDKEARSQRSNRVLPGSL